MKKDWKKKLKRMGAVLLLAVLLVQTVGSHAYAADAGKAIKEEANVTESPDERIRVNQDEEKFNIEEKTFDWNPYAAV